MRIKGLGKIIKNTAKEWWKDNPFGLSAIIAYYAIFSLPALLVLIINIAGFFFGAEAVRGEISYQIESAMGKNTAEDVENIIAQAGESKRSIMATIIGIVTLILGATGVFVQLQKALNNIWEVEEKKEKGIMKLLRQRLFSFGLVVSIGFLMLVFLVVTSLLTALSHWLQGILPDFVTVLMYLFDLVVSVAVISTMFALMFKILPDVKLRWKNVWIGAVLTAILFIIGKYGLGIYFGKAAPASVYGTAGSIVLILLWVSYSSMIVFFGAEFTKQYAVYHKLPIKPNSFAENVTIKKEHGGQGAIIPSS